VGHFARVHVGIDVLLRLESGLNKVDVAKKQAGIYAHDFLFHFQADQPEDQLELGQPVSQPHVLGLKQILEKYHEVFALEKWCAASTIEIELLPGRTGSERRSQGDAEKGNL